MILNNPSGRRTSAFLAIAGLLILCTLWLSRRSTDDSSAISFPPLDHFETADRPHGSNPQSATAQPTGTAQEEEAIQNPSPAASIDVTDCRNAPGARDIYIAFKIGISEIYQKLPPHLLTLFKCVPHYGIYSDVEQTVGGQHVIDAIHDLNSSVQSAYKEFGYYRQMRTLFADGQDVSGFQGDDEGDDRLGWILDKWKWLQSYRKAYLAHPDKKWYLFMEGDTFIHWNNLLQWTRQLDPEQDIYTGSQNAQGGVSFAHGGSGVLVSRGAMHKLMSAYDNMLPQWQADIADSCCGDVVMARHFKDAGVEMTPSFPILQGETPLTVDWNARHMCAPSVGWHHVNAMEIDRLWELQTNWTREHGWDKPMLFRDLFKVYVEKYARERRDDWDNITADRRFVKSGKEEDQEKWLSHSDIERQSIESFENCRAACEAWDVCRQFRYKEAECSLGENVRIGKAGDGIETSSGWILDRVKAFGKQFADCEANWAFDQ